MKRYVRVALVFVHYGLVTDIPATLLSRAGTAEALGQSAVTVSARTAQLGGYTVTRTVAVVDAQAGKVRWSLATSDFGSADARLLFLGPWELFWTVTPAPSGSPGRYPEGAYDTLWIVP